MIKELGRAPLPTEFGDWTYVIFSDDINNYFHETLIFGDTENISSKKWGKNILVRVHSACRTNEIFHTINCECRKQLHQAMRLIQKEKKGIIIYLNQEGRGNGIEGKLAELKNMFGWKDGKIHHKFDVFTGERIDTYVAYKNAGYISENRDFSVAGHILKSFGVSSIRLLTNNPIKTTSVKSKGIKVTQVEIHILPDNEIIATNLYSKAKNFNHKISKKYWQVKKSLNRRK